MIVELRLEKLIKTLIEHNNSVLVSSDIRTGKEHRRARRKERKNKIICNFSD